MNALARRRLLSRLTKAQLISLVVDGCEMCEVPPRITQGMVCQVCGKDYAPREAAQ